VARGDLQPGRVLDDARREGRDAEDDRVVIADVLEDVVLRQFGEAFVLDVATLAEHPLDARGDRHLDHDALLHVGSLLVRPGAPARGLLHCGA